MMRQFHSAKLRPARLHGLGQVARRAARGACVAAGALVAASSQAEVSSASPSAFTLQHRAALSVPIEKAWEAVPQLPRWWNSRHTYSGQASNLSLDAQAGGCWCERWSTPAGPAAVQHGRVLLLLPQRMLRVEGAFGPLQEMAVTGILSVATLMQDGQPTLRMSYRVTGAIDSQLDKLAPIVDQVIGEQFQRLKKLAETGSAD